MGERFLLHVQIRLDITVCRADLFMAQPKRDDCDGHPGLQQMHGAGVTPTVKRDDSVTQRWTGRARLFNSQSKAARGLAPRKGFKLTISEEGLSGPDLVLLAPLLDLAASLIPERYFSLFPSLPV